MNAPICRREEELLAALGSGRWPEASDRDLLDHVAGCAECAVLAFAATAIDADRREGERHAPLPPSGAVWWRMQMRMAREAEEAAARTVRRAHAAIVLVTLGALTALLVTTKLLGVAWNWLLDAMPRYAELPSIPHPNPSITILLIGGAALLLIAPVIAWLAVTEE